MEILKLVASLVLDDSQFQEQMGEAEKDAASFGDKLKGGLGTAAKIGGAAVTAVATTAVAFGTELVKQTGAVASYGDNIDKMSQKMGLSAEAYQEWDAIMQHSGTSIDSLQSGMKTLANAVENGNKAFERLGISEEDIASMNNEQLFSATITALQNVENETERTYLAGQLLGRGATELGALLNTSAEDTEAMRQRVHELGGVMSDDAVKAAAAYQDSLQDMQTAFSGLSRNLMSDFLPSMTSVMDGLTELFAGEGGTEKISEGIFQATSKITERAPQVLETASSILLALLGAISANLPMLSEAAVQVLITLSMGIIQQLPTLIEAGEQILFALMDGLIEAMPEMIPAIIQVILTIVEKLTEPDTLVHLVDAAFQILGALAKGIIEAVPKLVESVPVIISNLVTAIAKLAPQLLASGTQLVTELGAGILNAIPELINVFSELFGKVRDWIHEKIEAVKEWGKDLIGGFVDGIVGGAARLWDTVKGVAQGIKDFLGFSEPEEGPLSNFHTFAPDMMELFAKGIRDGKKMLQDTVADAFDFGELTTESGRQSATASGSAGRTIGSNSEEPITIVVQSVLDGEIIGESSYRYLRKKRMIEGVS